jgi:hypothetical protein
MRAVGKQRLPAGSVEERDYAADITKIHVAGLQPRLARSICADAGGLAASAGMEIKLPTASINGRGYAAC